MDKIVKNHLDSGFLVSPQLYELAKNNNNILIIPNGTVATQGIVAKYSKPNQKEYTPHELSLIYTERFRFLSTILKDKIKPTSIDKLLNGRVETIGIIHNGVLEDSTGSIKISFSGQLIDDEVIGVRGSVSGGVLNIEEVIYPDIPLSNIPHYSENKIPLCLSFGDENWKKEKATKKRSFFIKIETPLIMEIDGVRMVSFSASNSKQTLHKNTDRSSFICLTKNAN